MGNCTRDIELKYLQSGKAVTDLGLAVNEKHKSSSGEWVESAVFVDITLWGRTAEIASEYISKGDPVFIEGRLRYESWESDGQKRSKLKVVGEKLQLLGGKKSRSHDSSNQGSQQGYSQYSEPSQAGRPGGSHEAAARYGEESEIPF